MNAPQWIMAALIALGLLLSSHQHGKPKTGTNSLWVALIANAITFGLMWWGGFWG